MICPNCGTQLDDDANFCHQCGVTVVDRTQPVDTEENTDTKYSAPQQPMYPSSQPYGYQLPVSEYMKCPKCNKLYDNQVTFCNECQLYTYPYNKGASWGSWFAYFVLGIVLLIMFYPLFYNFEAGLPLTIACLPVIIILIATYFSKKTNRPPLNMVALTLFYGLIAAIPIIIVELILLVIFAIGFFSTQVSDVARILVLSFFMSFIVAGLTEEVFKFLSIRIHAYNHPSFQSPMDGFIYAISASMGFALIENILYVVRETEISPLMLALLRGLTAIPLHALCGAFMGYYLGMNKIKGKYSLWHVLLVPIFIHGIYNFSVFSLGSFSSTMVSLIVSFCIVIIVGVIFIPKFRELRKESMNEDSKYTNEYLDPEIIGEYEDNQGIYAPNAQYTFQEFSDPENHSDDQ